MENSNDNFINDTREDAFNDDKASIHPPNPVNQLELLKHQLNTLESFMISLSEISTLEQLYRVLFQYISKNIGECNVFLALYDQNKKEIAIPFAIEDGIILQLPTMPLGKGLVSKIIESRTAILQNEEAHLPSQSASLSGKTKSPQSWLGVPLLHNQKPIGAIVLQDPKNGLRFSEKDKQLLIALSRPVVYAIQTISSTHNLKQQLDHQSVLLQNYEDQQRKISTLTDHLHDTLDMDLILQLAVTEIRELFSLEEVEILLSPEEMPKE